MPVLSDPIAIRSVLSTDRVWSVYALGDLTPGFFEHCSWLGSENGVPAVVLVYRAFETPVLFALGEPPAVGAVLSELASEDAFYLHVRPEIVPLLQARYSIVKLKPMWRMVLPPANYRPAAAADAIRLGPADVESITRLFADGESTGEAPDFFSAAMVHQGVYFGIQNGADLVSVAGTHILSPQEGVAAIGNIYTRRDCRRRGLAARATTAVINELVRRNIETVALNVGSGNTGAIRLYEALGFVKHCAFCEGLAQRRERTMEAGRGDGARTA
jgi:ribosomal protein S18 acetylase RimI-like enzyme